MPHWVSQISSVFSLDKPLLVAAVCDVTGASPDGSLGMLILSEESVATNIINDVRRDLVIADARRLLIAKKPWTEITYPLGQVMDRANGECHVVYQYFDGSGIVSWIQEAETLIGNRANAWLAFRKDEASKNSSVILLSETGEKTLETRLRNQLNINSDTANKIISSAFKSTQLLSGKHGRILMLPIKVPPGPVTIIGRHRVAIEIIRLLAHLPVSVEWTAGEFLEADPAAPSITRICMEELPPHLTVNSPVVIIMSNDHQWDLRLCEQALRHPAVQFVGCIGSGKKATLVKQHLLAKGMSKGSLNKLHMPVGLPTITGKHPAVIAASVVAQILTVYPVSSDDQLTISRLPD